MSDHIEAPEGVRDQIAGIELAAARRAYAAELGASEWEAILTKEDREAISLLNGHGTTEGEVALTHGGKTIFVNLDDDVEPMGPLNGHDEPMWANDDRFKDDGGRVPNCSICKKPLTTNDQWYVGGGANSYYHKSCFDREKPMDSAVNGHGPKPEEADKAGEVFDHVSDMENSVFRITWRDAAYRVNLPGYNGGEVVPAGIARRVVKRLQSKLAGERSALAESRAEVGLYSEHTVSLENQNAILRAEVGRLTEKLGWMEIHSQDHMSEITALREELSETQKAFSESQQALIVEINEVERLREEVTRLRGYVKIVAKQQIPTEMDDESAENSDYQGAYEDLIEEAREALLPAAPKEGGTL